jgi:poly(A) polymerase
MKLDLSNFPLMGDSITNKLFQLFESAGIKARFVGGCVRDAVLGVAAEDIDIAVPIPPDQVIFHLTKPDINVIPTGYDFGTITAVVNGRTFQITSLRKDWETDGRHAKVTYGTDWHEDAQRRDFTINALYADHDGTIHDYYGGLEDLKFGIVRFVGDASQRIQEDYLRILRYFRFLAWYGHGPVNLEAVQACTTHGHGLKGLSRERIGHEFIKLLGAPLPLPSLNLMSKANVAQYIVPQPLNLQALEVLINFEKSKKAMRRLAALLLPVIEVEENSKALRLSRQQKQYLQRCNSRIDAYPSSIKAINRNLYEDGVELFQDLTMLSLTLRPLSSTPTILEEALKFASTWSPPIFPIKGKDLVSLGFKPGPKMGALLKQCEEWWVEENFQPDRDACLKWIREQQKKPQP